jgi:hypothetical protein
MSTETRLRYQPVTHKPRVIADGGRFKIEYLGAYTGQHCGWQFNTHGEAIAYALDVARRQASRIAQFKAAA